MREACLFVLENGYQSPVSPTQAQMWSTTAQAANPTFPVGTGTGNFAAFYARLDGGDAFTMRPRPQMVTVPYGGGVAIPAFTVGDKMECVGAYRTKWYAGAFGNFLIQWACQQVNALGYVAGAGVSTGWQYGNAAGSVPNYCGNLPSVSIFHSILRGDGTWKIRLYSGVRVRSWSFTISENSTISDFNMELTGAAFAGNQWSYRNYVDPTLQNFVSPPTPPTFGTGSTPSTFCLPSTVSFPVNPYLFIDTGPVTIGANPRTQFQSLAFNCTNHTMARWWNQRFQQISQMNGRDLTMTLQNYYVTVNPEDRVEYEGLVPQIMSFTMDNGRYAVTWQMNANSIIRTLEDVLPLDDIYTETVTLTSQFDPSYAETDPYLAGDFEVTFNYSS